MNPRRDDQTDIRWLAVRNDSGEEIPAYAAMMRTGVYGSDGVPLVTKPDTADIDPAFILINGPAVIPDEMDGAGTRDADIVALAPSAAFKDSLGTQASSWNLHVGNVGFLCMGAIDSNLAIVVNTYRALVIVECDDGTIVGQSPDVPGGA